MAKQLTDDEQNLRRKARRRLIGAIVLTMALVVILPMVLDNEPKLTGQDVDLRIPSPDRAGEFLPKLAASAVMQPPTASAVVPPELPAIMPSAAQSAVMPGKEPVAVTTPKVQAQVQAPAEKAVPAESSAKPVGGERFVAQIGAYANPDSAKQELGKLKKWGCRAYTEKVGDKVRVRVGPYADRDKAEKARRLLGKHGLHAVVMSAQAP